MKLQELIQTVPDLTEEKLYNGIQKIINVQSIHGSNFYSLFRDRDWTPEEIMSEWELIQLKSSNLSRSKRDMISIIVSKVLFDMVNEIPKENTKAEEIKE